MMRTYNGLYTLPGASYYHRDRLDLLQSCSAHHPGRREGHLPYGLRTYGSHGAQNLHYLFRCAPIMGYLFCLVLLIITGIDSASSSHVVPIILEDEKATSLRNSPHLLPYSSRTYGSHGVQNPLYLCNAHL